MPTCSVCGGELPPDAQFCIQCGQKTADIQKPVGPQGVPVCPKCGGELPPDAKFCIQCGQKTGDIQKPVGPQGVPVCPKCGGELPPDAKFCIQCGQKTGDIQKPVEPWATTLSVGAGCSLVVGMIIGYLGLTYGALAAIILLFLCRNPTNRSTSRPMFRLGTIFLMMVTLGIFIGILVYNLRAIH
jgi:ribosomal protein L40E